MADRDPKEEKVRDYLHDRRNVYGENDKSSRKAVRFRKAWINRRNRKAVNDALTASHGATDDDAIDAVVRKRWKKIADKPLGEVLDRRSGERRPDGDESPAQSEARRRGRSGG